MELEVGKLNGFFIDATHKWGTVSPYDVFTNATESELKTFRKFYIRKRISRWS